MKTDGSGLSEDSESGGQKKGFQFTAINRKPQQSVMLSYSLNTSYHSLPLKSIWQLCKFPLETCV